MLLPIAPNLACHQQIKRDLMTLKPPLFGGFFMAIFNLRHCVALVAML